MVDTAWRVLADASAAVAAVPAWQLSDADLVAALRGDRVAEAQRVAARLSLVRELDVRGYAVGLGCASTKTWLANELLLDGRVAAADVRAARQLDPVGDVPPAPGTVMSQLQGGEVQLAATGRALLAGEVSRAHADVIATAVRALPTKAGASLAERDDLHARAEASLLEVCARLAPEQVRRCADHIRHLVDPDGVLVDERDAVTRSTLWIKSDAEGAGYRLGGTTDAVTGAQLITWIDAHSAPHPVLNVDTGAMEHDPRLPETRRGHAFAELVRLAANADESVSGGTSTHLVVTTTLETLQAKLGERGIACADTENGQSLSAAAVRLLACDTTVIPIVLGAASEPLDVGRATRTIPVGIRRALTARDEQCAFPGCDRPPRWADAHHIQHWADGGPTSLENLVLLCGHHHDVIHHTRWTVTIDDGQPSFRSPPGRAPRATAPTTSGITARAVSPPADLPPGTVTVRPLP